MAETEYMMNIQKRNILVLDKNLMKNNPNLYRKCTLDGKFLDKGPAPGPEITRQQVSAWCEKNGYELRPLKVPKPELKPSKTKEQMRREAAETAASSGPAVDPKVEETLEPAIGGDNIDIDEAELPAPENAIPLPTEDQVKKMTKKQLIASAMKVLTLKLDPKLDKKDLNEAYLSALEVVRTAQ